MKRIFILLKAEKKKKLSSAQWKMWKIRTSVPSPVEEGKVRAAAVFLGIFSISCWSISGSTICHGKAKNALNWQTMKKQQKTE